MRMIAAGGTQICGIIFDENDQLDPRP